MTKFVEFGNFCHSNGNFPEGQVGRTASNIHRWGLLAQANAHMATNYETPIL